MDLTHGGVPLIGSPLEGGLNFAARVRYTQGLEYSEDQPLPIMCIMDEEQAAYTERSKLGIDDQEQLYKELEDEGDAQEQHEDSPQMEGPEDSPQMEGPEDMVIELQEITLEKVEEPQISAGTEEMLEQDANDVVPQKKQKKLLFYVHGGNYPETVSEALIARGNWQQYPQETECVEKCHFVWKPFNYNADGYKRIDKRVTVKHAPFIYNHFEVLKGLVTKSGLIRSLKQYYYNNDSARQASYTIFDSTPTTFLLQSGCDDSEWAEFNQRYRDIQRGYAPKERIPIKHCVNNIWLVKPANANQGRGIEIFSELDEMTQFINSRPQFTCCVVQKYIERPLLFKGRKFDIRVWALVNCKNEVFMYRHGYLRTSSDDYNLTNGNNYVHLTNNCLQKFGTNYGVHEDGNTVGFHVFQAYLEEQYPQYGLNVERDFIPKMKDLIIDTLNATKAQLNPNRRKHVFELLGYDFLIDEDFRLWLIEVNTNPYFGVPNGYIADLLPKMMDDLFDIVVDPIYPPDVKPPRLEKPNDFELIYSETLSVNQRRSFGTSHYPVADLAQQVGHKAARQDLKYLRQFKIMNLNLSTYGFKKAKEQPVKPNAHQAQILVHANQANRARNSAAALRSGNNQSNVRKQRAREASSEQKQRSKSLMLGGVGGPRCIASIQPSPTKKNIEIVQPSQLKTIQTKNSESIGRQSSKPRFSTSLAQHSLSRQYGMGKKGVNGISINQASIQNQANFILKAGGSSENRPQAITTSSSQEDKMIKFRKFLNKSQAQTPTKVNELNTVEQSSSPPQDQKEEDVTQIQVALIQKESTNTGDSVKSDHTNSSIINQNIIQTVVKANEDIPKIQQHSSSLDIFSSGSSQEKFVSRRLREKSFERLANSAQERHGLPKTDPFEVLFSTLLTRVGKETQDDIRIRDNLNTLQSLIDLNMLELIRQERHLIDLLGVAVRQNQHLIVANHLLGIIDLYKDRLHFKQSLSRNVTLQKLMIKMYTQTRDQEVRKRLLKILAAMSCTDESSKKLESPKKDKDISIELGRGRSSTSKTRANPHKGTANADTSSLNIIRQTIYRKAVQNGLILFLLSRSSDTWLLNLLSQKDKCDVLSQLSCIVNSDSEPKYPAPPEPYGLDINTDSENTFATIERSVQHRINIIDLSREEKPIEVYTGELFPSKGQQLLQLVKSVIPLRAAIDLMQQLQVQSEPELLEQSGVDNSRISGKSSTEKPSYKRRQQVRDESLTVPNSALMNSPQTIQSQKMAIKKKDTPESSSFKGNAQIRGQSKSPFTGTAIKVKGNMSPVKQSIGLSNKPSEGRRQSSPSFIKKEASVDQKSPPGPHVQKKSAKKLVKASKNVASIEKPSTNALKSRLKQVDDSILNCKQKSNKFKPVLKSKVPSVTSTPYAQQSQLKKQPSMNPFVNPNPVDRRKSVAQNPQKRMITSQLNSKFNADLTVADDSKPKVVLQEELIIANTSTRKSGIHSQLSQYKNSSSESQFNPQLSYYQDGPSQKPRHKYKRNAEDQMSIGNLQRAVMDSMEKKIQEIQESLNTIQNRQRKVASPRSSDNSDLQMVNYHNKRERAMQESVPNLYLPYQRASVGLQNTNESFTSDRKIQNTVSGSHHYLDASDQFDQEDRIKLFSTIQETRAISPRQSKYQHLFIEPRNFDFPLQRQNQLNGTLKSKNSSKLEDPHSSQSNRNQGSQNPHYTYGRMGGQKSPTYIDIV